MLTFLTKIDSKWPQDGPKIAPRWLQDGPKNDQKTEVKHGGPPGDFLGNGVVSGAQVGAQAGAELGDVD